MKMLSKIGMLMFILNLALYAQPQIQSGGFFFNTGTPGYTLNQNEGRRIVETEIRFNKPFDTKPYVYTSVILVDAENKTKIRYAIEPKSVSRDGFVLSAIVWGDTRLNAIGGFWMAEAEVVKLEKVKIEVGSTIELNNVEFDFNKATLRAESFEELDNVVKFLNDNPSVEIELAGHTDNIGDDNYNLKLSQERAESVKNYLVEKGISESRLIAKGYGESRPIASNQTEQGRDQNRRVEFTILKK